MWLLFLFSLFSVSAKADDASQITQLLRTKDQALLDAIAPGNAKIWDDALASNAIYVDENGVIMDRAAFFKQFAPLPAGASGNIVISSYQATLHDDVATVIHTDDETENYHGQILHARYLMTETWQKKGGDWKLLQVHAYAMLKDPPAIQLSTKELDEYAGTYVAGDLKQTLHRNGNHLASQREGRPDIPWDAELHDIFFVEGQPRIRKIFQRDADGKITGFVDRRESWDLVWKKTQ